MWRPTLASQLAVDLGLGAVEAVVADVVIVVVAAAVVIVVVALTRRLQLAAVAVAGLKVQRVHTRT